MTVQICATLTCVVGFDLKEKSNKKNISIVKEREILGKDFSMQILRDLKTYQKGREMGDT